MNCTSCNQGTLQPAYLDALFPCQTCNHCGGNLVFLSDYLRWVNSEPGAPVVSDIEVAATETEKAMLCPQTKNLMLKYRISHKLEHKLDLSPAINAIWLDKGEWELLKQEGLAFELNAIFTDSWQKKIRQAKTQETLEGLYDKTFGEHYPAIKAFKAQLDTFDNKAEVIAYLLADDPYKI